MTELLSERLKRGEEILASNLVRVVDSDAVVRGARRRRRARSSTTGVAAVVAVTAVTVAAVVWWPVDAAEPAASPAPHPQESAMPSATGDATAQADPSAPVLVPASPAAAQAALVMTPGPAAILGVQRPASEIVVAEDATAYCADDLCGRLDLPPAVSGRYDAVLVATAYVNRFGDPGYPLPRWCLRRRSVTRASDLMSRRGRRMPDGVQWRCRPAPRWTRWPCSR